MIPRLRPALGWSEFAAAATQRRSVGDFEGRFAELMGQRHAIAFPYGRTAQLMLIRALGIRDREIICPAYTCVVVAHAIVKSGNVPVFVDSEPDGFNMDLDAAAAAVTPRTAAIVATSIHGYPVDLTRLRTFSAAAPQVQVIQDCAHSFAAQYQGAYVQQAGIAAVFGLNVSKLMTSVFGGMITTDDAALAKRLRTLAAEELEHRPFQNIMRLAYLAASAAALHPVVFGLVDRIRRAGLIDRFTTYYSDDIIDMPGDYLAQIGRVEASVGFEQCGHYPDIVARRRRIAEVYDQTLAAYPALLRPPLVTGATYSHYVARVADPQAVLKAAAIQGVELGRLIDYCVPDMKAYRSYDRSIAFPRTQALNASVINLPVWVDEATATRIAHLVGQAAQALETRI